MSIKRIVKNMKCVLLYRNENISLKFGGGGVVSHLKLSPLESAPSIQYVIDFLLSVENKNNPDP